MAWTVYGLIVSQYMDLDVEIDVPGDGMQTMKHYITNYYGYREDFMPVVAVVLVAFCVFFAFMYAYCIKKLNFQQR